MTDIEDFDKDITDALDNLQKDIDNVGKKDPSQKQKLISKCASQIQSIAMMIESYELEIHSLDKVKAVSYKESLKTIQNRFQRLKNELEFKKSEIQSNTLFGNKPTTNLKEMSSGQLIELGDRTQDQGIDSLKNTLKMVNEGNQLADDINIELNEQIKRLENATETVKESQVIIKRANEYVKYFTKQIYTDKILLCLIFLAAAGIVAIVVLRALGKSIPNSDNDVITSQST